MDYLGGGVKRWHNGEVMDGERPRPKFHFRFRAWFNKNKLFTSLFSFLFSLFSPIDTFCY
jgi:hypothetical protein